MSKIIVLIGPPGSGKGTQARLLQEHMGLPHISTGDMFRAMKQAQTPLGEQLRPLLALGLLVPDDLTFSVVQERTRQSDCRDGYVLDGFPRTPAQAVMLETLAVEQGHGLLPILIDVPFDILEKRVMGRRSCPVCGEIYNIYLKPPKFDEVCDLHPGVQLTRRSDDNVETIKTRLATYEESRPIIEYYEKTDRLRRVDGTRDTEAIYAEIEKVVKSEEW